MGTKVAISVCVWREGGDLTVLEQAEEMETNLLQLPNFLKVNSHLKLPKNIFDFSREYGPVWAANVWIHRTNENVSVVEV